MSLLYTLRYQLKKDTTEYKMAMVDQLLRNTFKGKIFRLVNRWLPIQGKAILALIWAFFQTQIKWPPTGDNFFLYRFPSEKKQLETFLIHELEIRGNSIYCGFRFVFFDSWFGKAEIVVPAYRIAKKLLKKYPLFVTLRALEALFYYFEFKEKSGSKRDLNVYVSTLSQPYTSALLGLYRIGFLKLHFKAHSPLVDSPLRTFLESAFIYGRAMRLQFEQEQSVIQRYVLTSQELGPITERSRNNNLIVLALSKVPNWRTVIELVSLIENENHCSDLRVGLRLHPNQISKTPEILKKLVLPEETFVQATQNSRVVIAGNSTVHLHALALGVPSFYSPLIDSLENLDLNFIEEEGIREFDIQTIASLEQAQDSYSLSFYERIRLHYYGQSFQTDADDPRK